MSLRVWLPLNGDLRNNGLSDLTFSITSSNTSINNNGKIGKCYNNNSNSGGGIISNKAIELGTNVSMCCWFKFTSLESSSSLGGGLVSQHCYNDNTGLGITIRYVSSTTGYISCSTGTGSSRTYNTYYGTTLLQADTWYHAALTYDGSLIKLYLNGILEKTQSYPSQKNRNNYIAIFAWSVNNGSIHGDYKLNGYLNDVRIYDHALSVKEVKELSKGLVCHYPLNQAFPIDNLVRNQTYVAYNNYSSSGSTATLVKTGKKYNDCDIYRLTYTPNDTSLNHVKTTLGGHGVYGFRQTFKADTKYCFWILWRAISHPDTICGGTASNIGGWTEIPTKKFGGEWNVVGQYRDGSVTTDKTDNIFTSFKTPSATSGTPIIIDFCCPYLVEGYDYILEENGYSGDTVTKIYDTSGNGYNGTKTGTLILNDDTPRNSKSTLFSGSEYIALGNQIYGARDEITVNLWCYKDNWNSNKGTPFSCVEGGGYGWQVSGTNYNFYCGTGVSSNTYISSAVTTSSLSSGWHMLSATYDGLVLRVYIDGVLKNTVTKYTTKTPIFYNVNSGMFISGESAGSLVSPSGGLYTGSISDVRIYCTALSEQDIEELYQVCASIDNNGNVFAYEFKED